MVEGASVSSMRYDVARIQAQVIARHFFKAVALRQQQIRARRKIGTGETRLRHRQKSFAWRRSRDW